MTFEAHADDLHRIVETTGFGPVEFPGDHGGFVADEWSPGSDPEAFAAKLREVLEERS